MINHLEQSEPIDPINKEDSRYQAILKEELESRLNVGDRVKAEQKAMWRFNDLLGEENAKASENEDFF